MISLRGKTMRLWGLLLLCAVTAAASADQLYKWVDEQGKVHYSQTPPPGAGTKAKLVDVPVARPDADTQLAAEAQAKQDEGAQDMDPAARQRLCDGLKAQLSAYSHSDDKAVKAAHQKEMDDLKAQIAKDCD